MTKRKSRIVEDYTDGMFVFIKPSATINYKEITHLIYTGNTILPRDVKKRSLSSFIEAWHRKLPVAERGREYYANLLTAMAGEIPKGGKEFAPTRPPYFNELIFQEAYKYISNKLKVLAEKKKPKWTMEQAAAILIYTKPPIENLDEAKKYAKEFNYRSDTSGRRLKFIYDKFTVTLYRTNNFHKILGIESALKPTQLKRYEKDRNTAEPMLKKYSVKKV